MTARSFLLDTHIWVWMLADSPRLAGRACEIVEDPRNGLRLSAASAWEISTKVHAGRLTIPIATLDDFHSQLRLTDVDVIDLELSHAVAAGALPRHHGDPFDRMIVAQAQSLGIPVITADPMLAAYDVDVITI